MIFYSLPFLCFFIIHLVLMQNAKTCRQQHIVMLLANIVFYAYWDIRFLLLLFSVITVCYFCALSYIGTKKKIYITFSAVYCLGVLCVFKYLNFFIASFCSMFGLTQGHTLQLILPLGISFYLFQALSYVFDVQKGTIAAEKDYLRLAAYISFYPQITSGPIVKAHDFLPQLDRLHRITKENLSSGIQLFLLGLTKKLVFADRIGVAVDAVFAAPKAYNGISILWAVIGYSLQIYCDFSGYSDMARGIAKILDFDLGKNFDLPYLAGNPSDFWSRWHISLSSWFREYVYIPLGGNRSGRLKTYRNLFITMLLSGIWHGASWTFVLWGLLHAAISTLYKMLSCRSDEKPGRIADFASILLNYTIVSLLWVIFRAENVNQALEIWTGLFRSVGITYVNTYVVVYFVILSVCGILSYLRNKGHFAFRALDLERFSGQFAFFVWILLILAFMYAGNSAFIYAQF